MNKHEIISTIYNEVWKYYKQFLQDKDMKQYNSSCQNLIKNINGKGDKAALDFCQNLIITFTPIINQIKEWNL